MAVWKLNPGIPGASPTAAGSHEAYLADFFIAAITAT